MKKLLFISLLVFASIAAFRFLTANTNLMSGAPPYYVDDDVPIISELQNEYSYLDNWKRPDGPARVGLQVGHWKNNELPSELERLRGNTGATGGGKSEWEVNLAIAKHAKEILEKEGIQVDILPATIPPDYFADAFIAIHADGSLDQTKSGYKAAAPRRDLTQNAEKLVSIIESEYEKATLLSYDPNVTRNMRGYYAFSYWRFHHTVHPMTTAIILETGFLSNPNDRQIIVDNPELAATGLTNGVLKYLREKNLV